MQVGKVTSHTWSPILKKYIAMTSVLTPHARSARSSRWSTRSSSNERRSRQPS
jgi:glycine cleavage system aminomethyltransferase T